MGLIFGLTSALSHSIWNICAKHGASKGHSFVYAYTFLSALLLCPLAFIDIWVNGHEYQLTWLWLCLTAGLLHAGYSILLNISYRHSDVSQTYPLSRGLAPILVATFASIFMNQQLSIGGWIAIGLMSTAILLLIFDATKQRLRQSLSWGAYLALAISSYTLFDGWAITHMHIPPLTYYLGTGLSQLLFTRFITRPEKASLREHITTTPISMILIATLMPLSYVSALYATQYLPIAHVTTLRSLSIACTAILSWYFLHEKLQLKRILSTILATCAVVVLSIL